MCSTFLPLTLSTLWVVSQHQWSIKLWVACKIPRKYAFGQTCEDISFAYGYCPSMRGSLPVPRTTTSYSGAISSMPAEYIWVVKYQERIRRFLWFNSKFRCAIALRLCSLIWRDHLFIGLACVDDGICRWIPSFHALTVVNAIVCSCLHTIHELLNTPPTLYIS